MSNKANQTIETIQPLRTRVLVLQRLDEIQTLPVKWLWRHRIARGMFGLFPGREGDGKSLVVFDLVAKITKGILEGDDYGTPRKVLICATEDSFAHTVVPRLIAAGADLTMIARIHVRENQRDDELNLPVDLDALSREVIANQVALVVLDPLMSRLSAKLDTHKDADVRRALEPIVKLADDTGASVLGIIHLNKGSNGDPLNAIMGSRAFSAVSRWTLYLTTDPDDDAIRLVGQAKNNCGPSHNLPLLPFLIETFTFTNEQGDVIETARVVWQTPDATRTLHEVLRQHNSGGGRDTSALDDAVEWLRAFLTERADHQALSSEIKLAAAAADHSDRTLKRAAGELGVKVTPKGRNTVWALPPKPLAGEDPPF